MKKFTKWHLVALIGLACNGNNDSNALNNKGELAVYADTVATFINKQTRQNSLKGKSQLVTSKVSGTELVQFAQTLEGIPYKYASSNPITGFDCSGFITHVFGHFHIQVPRSSVDFTHMGQEVEPRYAEKGDLILFTGTVDSIRIVGHMGIVTENKDTLKFIHATSGKAYGVTITALNNQYKRRFVKIIRVLPD